MGKIVGLVDSLKEQVATLLNRIAIIQEQCSHPKEAVTKVHKANTGNYDPSCDCYWTEFTCHLCHKYWHEDGSR